MLKELKEFKSNQELRHGISANVADIAPKDLLEGQYTWYGADGNKVGEGKPFLYYLDKDGEPVFFAFKEYTLTHTIFGWQYL